MRSPRPSGPEVACIAPRFALVAHHRTDIAHLRSDRTGAIDALRRG